MFRSIISILLFAVLPSSAAPMLRVLQVRDSHTLVVDRNGIATTVQLAAVEVSAADEQAARAFLESKVLGNWVLAEDAPGGGSFVYSAPDALYLNAELARRAYAIPATRMIYLGQAMPAPSRVGKSTSPPKASATPHIRRTPVLIRRAPRPRSS